MEELWNEFDAIYCINLISRPERYMEVTQLFNKYNIPVQFHQVVKDPRGGAQGCFESHVNVCKKALECGHQRILIFEDDLEINDNAISNYPDILSFLKSDTQWNLLYLGSSPAMSKWAHAHRPSIYQVHSWLTHAYAINSVEMLQWVSELKFTGKPIDEVFLNEISLSYATYPSLFYQNFNSSDIGFYGMNLGGIVPISISRKPTQFLEWWAYNMHLPILYVIIVILIAIYIWVSQRS